MLRANYHILGWTSRLCITSLVQETATPSLFKPTKPLQVVLSRELWRILMLVGYLISIFQEEWVILVCNSCKCKKWVACLAQLLRSLSSSREVLGAIPGLNENCSFLWETFLLKKLTQLFILTRLVNGIYCIIRYYLLLKANLRWISLSSMESRRLSSVVH